MNREQIHSYTQFFFARGPLREEAACGGLVPFRFLLEDRLPFEPDLFTEPRLPLASTPEDFA